MGTGLTRSIFNLKEKENSLCTSLYHNRYIDRITSKALGVEHASAVELVLIVQNRNNTLHAISLSLSLTRTRAFCATLIEIDFEIWFCTYGTICPHAL